MRKNNFKNNIKLIVSKLPLFIFCVLFMKGYITLFGDGNSIAGVVILVGLLMFMAGNLGFESKQAAISIFFMFIIITVAPKVSLINPLVGIIINFTSIYIILMLCSVDSGANNQLTFMLGYIFFQGYDVSGDVYAKRVISLIIGGALISIIYYIINRKKENTFSLGQIIKSKKINQTDTQWLLKLTIVLSMVMFLGQIFNYPRTMWIGLTVLSLITPVHEEYLFRRKARIPATLIGCTLFVVIFKILLPQDCQSIFMLAAGFVSMFINSYFIKTIYNSFSALTTSVLLFPSMDIISVRVLSNIIGVIIVMVCIKILNKAFDHICPVIRH